MKQPIEVSEVTSLGSIENGENLSGPELLRCQRGPETARLSRQRPVVDRRVDLTGVDADAYLETDERGEVPPTGGGETGRRQRLFESIHSETAAIVEACGIPPAANLVADLVLSQDKFLETEAVPFSDAFPAIESLSESGVKTAIVSNCSRSTQAVVNRLGLRDRVDKVVLSFEVGSAKPDSEIFRHALRLLYADTGLFVDDQISYLDGAARVGLSTVQMIHPEARNPKPPQATHDVVTSLVELTEHVNAG